VLWEPHVEGVVMHHYHMLQRHALRNASNPVQEEEKDDEASHLLVTIKVTDLKSEA